MKKILSGQFPRAYVELGEMFVLNIQADPGQSLEELQEKTLSIVSKLSLEFSDLDLMNAKAAFSQLKNSSKIDTRWLPKHVTTVMARTNMELQVMMREIVIGDLDHYTKPLENLNKEAIRLAIKNHLNPDKARILFVLPEEK